MPHVKGQERPPGSGRKVGTMNKNSKFLWQKLKDMYGDQFDPVMQMAENAVRLQTVADQCWAEDKTVFEESDIKPEAGIKLIDKISTANNAINAWDKIAKFTTPTLKQIEITTAEAEDTFVPWELVKASVDEGEADNTFH